MAYLLIHCDVCGGQWEIYHRDDWKDRRARQCPHCFSEIDPQTWSDQVLPAFGMVHDANTELYKDHAGSGRPLFSFDVIADHLYKNRWAYRADNTDDTDSTDDTGYKVGCIELDDLELDDPSDLEFDDLDFDGDPISERLKDFTDFIHGKS